MNSPVAFVERLAAAVNHHDLDGVVDCFHEDYTNETPAHPARSFVGREQVRRNWQRMFDGVPDLRADVLRTTVDGDSVWSEWEMRGTRGDDSPHLLRGVIIFGIEGGRAARARFYLEPVDVGETGVDEAITRIVGSAP